MKKHLKIIIPIILVALGGGYKFALAKPDPAPPSKVHGSVYPLPREFLINLSDGRYAKLGVALVLTKDDHSLEPAGGGHGAAPKPPEGYGAMAQEALVRDIVTDTLTDRADQQLIDREGREKLKKKIAKAISKHTDVKVEDVLFTDVAVQ